MASGVDGLIAIDISNPLALVGLDVLDTPGEAARWQLTVCMLMSQMAVVACG
jgi:hypothetical protein